MRIIAGEKKGLTLSKINGNWIRPTSDKIRGALFSSIFSYFSEVDGFIDCFAGSGAIAIEAASRGIKNICLFDNNKKSARIIKDNLKRADYSKVIKFYPFSIQKGISILESENFKADIIFMDPPYKEIEQISDLLKKINESNLLKPEGLIIIEHDKIDSISNLFLDYNIIKEKKYGNTVLTFIEGK